MSKVIAIIKTDVPLENGLSDLKIKKADSKNLNSLLDEMEFRTIKTRMVNAGILSRKEGQLGFLQKKGLIKSQQ